MVRGNEESTPGPVHRGIVTEGTKNRISYVYPFEYSTIFWTGLQN